MKRYKCSDCGNFVSVLPSDTVTFCPICDGILILLDSTDYPVRMTVPSCKIQHLVFDDGTRELTVSSPLSTHAFRYGTDKDGSTFDWQPMGLVDVFKPYSKFKDCVGRIF